MYNKFTIYKIGERGGLSALGYKLEARKRKYNERVKKDTFSKSSNFVDKWVSPVELYHRIRQFLT